MKVFTIEGNLRLLSPVNDSTMRLFPDTLKFK